MSNFEGEYGPSTWEWVADQAAAYEASGGTEANTLRDTGLPIIVMTTRGHKSGLIRKVPLMRVEHEGSYALIASKGGAPANPGWYHNLMADPTVLVQDGPEPFEAQARLVTGDERATWWDRGVQAFSPYAEYQAKTDREIPVFVADGPGSATQTEGARSMTPEALVSATAGPVGNLGAAFYFHPDTLAAGKEIGLDGFRLYFLGRGGVLGDVEPKVVLAAFGYFNPEIVDKVWTSAKERCDVRTATDTYLKANADLGRARFGDIDPDVLEGFCDAAQAAADAVDPSALPLFAGVAAEPVPDDLPGRAMHMIMVHRELRGSLHLCAVVAAGMDPVMAHAERRPNDQELFGWPADQRAPEGTAAKLAEADAITDRLHVNVWNGADDEARAAYVAGVEAMAAAMESA